MIVNNRIGGCATVHLTSSESISLESLQVGEEVVSGMHIIGVCWSASTGITVTRNDVVLMELSGAGQWNLNECGGPFVEEPKSPIVVTISGKGTLVLHVRKQSSINGLEQPVLKG